jgi:hypothetical protein
MSFGEIDEFDIKCPALQMKATKNTLSGDATE